MTRLQKVVLRAIAILQSGMQDASDEKPERVLEFLNSNTVEREGEKTVVAVLRRKFIAWLPAEEREAWSPKKFAAALREHRAVKVYLGNKLVAVDTKLK